MRKFISACLLVALCGAAAPTAAQLPHLVKDLNSNAQGAWGSYPFNFVALGDQIFFATRGNESGYTIWKTDGTEEGTYRLAEVPGCQPSWNAEGPILDPLGDLVFFVELCAGADQSQERVWRTDGSVAGTFSLPTALEEIQTGVGSYFSDHKSSRVVDGRFYFGGRGSAESDLELWSSDGTLAGTSRVAASIGEPGSHLNYFAKVGGRLVTIVQQAYPSQLSDIWSSDGTAAGTIRLAGLDLGFYRVLKRGTSLLYFTALDPSDPAPGVQLWATDGSTQGTRALTSFAAEDGFESCATEPRILGNELLFCAADGDAGAEIWRSDGTSAGTFPLSAFGNLDPFGYYSLGGEATKLAGSYYFLGFGDDGFYSLWRSRGVPGAAVRVWKTAEALDDLYQGPWLETLGDRLVFWGFHDGWEPFVSDGTSQGTFPLAETCPGPCEPFVGAAGVVGDRLLFIARDANGDQQLWSTRGTKLSTFRLSNDLQDFEGGDERELQGAAFGDSWMFTARDSSSGFEPWSAQPARPHSAHRVRDLVLDTPGIRIHSPRALGSELGFSTRNDFELGNFGVYRTDGTGAGTIEIARTPSCDCGLGCATGPSEVYPVRAGVLFDDPEDCGLASVRSWSRATGDVVDLFGGPSGPRPGEPSIWPWSDEALVFLTPYALGTEIWRTDGSEAGTTLVLPATSSTQRYPLATLGGGLLLLSGATFSLPRLTYFDPSQGTVHDLLSYSASDFWPAYIGIVGASVYFSAQDDPLPDEVWRTDGTDLGTVHLVTLPPQHQIASTFSEVNGLALFGVYNWETGIQLWASDGSAAGTSELRNFPASVSGVGPFGQIGSRALFSMVTVDGNYELHSELWETDGASAGTRLLGDLSRDGQPAAIDRFLTGANALFFETWDAAQAAALWSSDGTLDGTRVLWTNPSPGEGSDAPRAEAVLLGVDLIFRGVSAEHGLELLVSDGTPAGTRLLVDLLPGPRSSNPQDLTIVGEGLFFTADDGIHGRELWALEALRGERCIVTATTLCLLAGRYRLELAPSAASPHAVPLTDTTGGFSFAGVGPPDLFFKIVDGSAFNRMHWLFGADLLAMNFTLRVTDTADGSMKQWTGPATGLASFGDIAAFPYLPGFESVPAASKWAPSALRTEGCSPSGTTLCFEGGRLLVEATAIGFGGAPTSAVASSLDFGPHDGAFWFFNAAILELVVRLTRDPDTDKVALAVAALTNLGYELRVLDTLTGRSSKVGHPPGQFQSLAIDDLFPDP